MEEELEVSLPPDSYEINRYSISNIENWFANQTDENTPIYTLDSQHYTPRQVLEEVTRKTELGRIFAWCIGKQLEAIIEGKEVCLPIEPYKHD